MLAVLRHCVTGGLAWDGAILSILVPPPPTLLCATTMSECAARVPRHASTLTITHLAFRFAFRWGV